MGSKYVMLALGTDLLLIFISMYFIYYGIASDQIIMSVIGGVLLVIGLIRLVIFAKTFKKKPNE